MDTVSTVAAVLLGIAFVVAGGSKLADGPAWPEQARGLDAPSITVPVVPWFELALGALLIVQVARVWVAGVALALVIVFTILIGRKLAQGERPPCACFGAWSPTPIGPVHLVRNAGLMVLAVVAMV